MERLGSFLSGEHFVPFGCQEAFVQTGLYSQRRTGDKH